LQNTGCAQMSAAHLSESGHCFEQAQPEQVSGLLISIFEKRRLSVGVAKACCSRAIPAVTVDWIRADKSAPCLPTNVLSGEVRGRQGQMQNVWPCRSLL
jgi:hypothetical protein